MDSKLKTLDQAQAEVDGLRQQVAELHVQNQLLPDKTTENARLREMLGFRDASPYRPARLPRGQPRALQLVGLRSRSTSAGRTSPTNLGQLGPAGRLAARRRRQDRHRLALRHRRDPAGERELQHLRHHRGHARPGHRQGPGQFRGGQAARADRLPAEGFAGRRPASSSSPAASAPISPPGCASAPSSRSRR